MVFGLQQSKHVYYHLWAAHPAEIWKSLQFFLPTGSRKSVKSANKITVVHQKVVRGERQGQTGDIS